MAFVKISPIYCDQARFCSKHFPAVATQSRNTHFELIHRQENNDLVLTRWRLGLYHQMLTDYFIERVSTQGKKTARL